MKDKLIVLSHKNLLELMRQRTRDEPFDIYHFGYTLLSDLLGEGLSLYDFSIEQVESILKAHAEAKKSCSECDRPMTHKGYLALLESFVMSFTNPDATLNGYSIRNIQHHVKRQASLRNATTQDVTLQRQEDVSYLKLLEDAILNVPGHMVVGDNGGDATHFSFDTLHQRIRAHRTEMMAGKVETPDTEQKEEYIEKPHTPESLLEEFRKLSLEDRKSFCRLLIADHIR